MTLIVFADVRAQPAALDALFRLAAREVGAEFVCLGGALPGPDPQGTLERLRKKGATLLAGSAERAFAKSDAFAALKPLERSYLLAASPSRRQRVGRRQVLMTTEPNTPGDLVVTPASCGALGVPGDAPFLVIDDEGLVERRTLAWSIATRHV